MSEMFFDTINPATGANLETYQTMRDSDLEIAVEHAFSAYQFLKKNNSVSSRALQLAELSHQFQKNTDKLALMVTSEMGKPLKDSKAEVEKCVMAFKFYSENLEKFLADEMVSSSYEKSFIVKESIGPVLAIMPWNFPLWQTIRFAAPAVGIGNPILLKHSQLTAGTAQIMAQIFNEVSPGLVFNLQISHDSVTRLIADPRIRGLTLTGSTEAGKKMGRLAGENLKKSVLELGGSDAYIVLADADIVKAAKIAAQARMVNNGQSCIAAKRFIVAQPIFESFLDHFKIELKKMRRADPLDLSTQVGPLAAKKFQTKILDQCQKLEASGGQKIFDLADDEDFDFSGKDAFFPARIYLVDHAQKMVFEEEFFGPVALVLKFETEDEAIELCNRSIFGLGGAVFSKDIVKAQALSRQMEAGFVAINDQVKSAAGLPFGGVKNSGYGRELGLYGFNEFCNIKTLGIQSQC